MIKMKSAFLVRHCRNISAFICVTVLELSLFVCVMGVCDTRCHIDKPVSSSSVLLALAEVVAAGVNLLTEALCRLLTFCSAIVDLRNQTRFFIFIFLILR